MLSGVVLLWTWSGMKLDGALGLGKSSLISNN